MAVDQYSVAPRVRRRKRPVESFLLSQSRVTDVWVKGLALLRNRELMTLHKEELRGIAEKWQQRLYDFKSKSSVS